MRRVKWILLTLLLCLGIYALFQWHPAPGYVLISYDTWQYESSLWFFLLMIAAFYFSWAILKRLHRGLRSGVHRANPWSQYNRERKAHANAERALTIMMEGDAAQALIYFRQAIKGAAHSLYYYLAAARAAENSHNSQESDVLLQQALVRHPKAEVVIDLTRADLQMMRGDMAHALQTLQNLSQKYPKHRQILMQLAHILEERGDWEELMTLFPRLEKHHAMPRETLDALEERLWKWRLSQSNDAMKTKTSLDKFWHHVPGVLRQKPDFIQELAKRYIALDEHLAAETLLHKSLKVHFDADLILLLTQVKSGDPIKQLQLSEKWLMDHPNDPKLLLALGKLCISNQLWGKAKDYLEKSMDLAPSNEACTLLAKMLAQQGHLEDSNRLLMQQLHASKWGDNTKKSDTSILSSISST